MPETAFVMWCMLLIVQVSRSEGVTYGSPATHKKLRKLCLVLDLPGKLNGPGVADFKKKWSDYLECAADDIFGENVSADARKTAAASHCSTLKKDDPKCAYLRLREIGDAVEMDVKRLEAKIGSGTGENWYPYAAQVTTWHLDWVMRNINCGTVMEIEMEPEYHWEFYAKISELKSRDQVCKWNKAFAKDVAQEVRKTVASACFKDQTDVLCKMKKMLEATDLIEELCSQVQSEADWKTPSDTMTAGKIVFYTLKIVPTNSHSALFKPETTAKAKEYMVQILSSFYSKLVTRELNYITKLLNILPMSASLGCTLEARYPSFEWLACSTGKVMAELRAFINTYGTPTKTAAVRTEKVISGSVNYVSLLDSIIKEEIQSMLQITSTNVIEVAKILQQNIGERFQSLSQFFTTMGDYDRQKYGADVGYITLRLGEYETVYFAKKKDLGDEMKKLIFALYYATSAQLAEQVALMAVRTAAAGNPLKWITGDDPGEVIESIQAVAEATAKIVVAKKIDDAWEDLRTASNELITNLAKNKDYQTNLKKVIDSVNASTPANDFEEAKDKFLKGYSDYTPAVRVDQLTGLTTKWENVIDAVCEEIQSTAGVIPAAIKADTIDNCARAKVYAQELIAALVELFEFQDELMAAMASVMRANTQLQAAKLLEDSTLINNSNTLTLDDLKPMAAISSISYHIMKYTAVYSYCDKLEYLLGKQPSVCAGLSTDIKSLKSHNIPKCQKVIKYTTIPTKPADKNDTAWISFKDIYDGKAVPFQVPNSQWLVDNGWIASNQKDYIFKVQGFEVYMPIASAKEKTVSVTVNPGNINNRLKGPSGQKYVITPSYPITFQYSEGFGASCRHTKLENPYHVCGNAEDKKLEDICLHTVSTTDDTRLFPSVYSTFFVKVNGYQGSGISPPSTPLRLQVGITLCHINPSTITRRSSRREVRRLAASRRARSVNVESRNDRRSTAICCLDNKKFENKETGKCDDCPAGTKNRYNGLYCGDVIRWVSGHTNLTFTAASKLCTDAGTTLATPPLLTEARNLGQKDHCYCGWLSDETVAQCKTTETCLKDKTYGAYCATKYS